MTLCVNGEMRALPGAGALSVEELLREMNVQERRVAVEVNKRLVPRAEFPEASLHDGDRVEIVRLVGGG